MRRQPSPRQRRGRYRSSSWRRVPVRQSIHAITWKAMSHKKKKKYCASACTLKCYQNTVKRRLSVPGTVTNLAGQTPNKPKRRNEKRILTDLLFCNCHKVGNITHNKIWWFVRSISWGCVCHEYTISQIRWYVLISTALRVGPSQLKQQGTHSACLPVANISRAL